MRPLLAPAVPPPHPSKLQRFLRHARRLALLALGPVESWWTWLFPHRPAQTAAGCSLSPESGLPFPPPKSARPTPTRPELDVLERRFFPGQTPTMLAGSLVTGGIAFLDQALLAGPLDPARDPANGSNAPLSGTGTASGNPWLTTAPDGAAPEAAAWLVADARSQESGIRSQESGTRPEAEASPAPAGPPASGPDLSAPVQAALFDDPLTDPLASAWPLDGSGRPKTPEVSPDPFAELPPSGGGGGGGGGGPGSGGLIPETPIATEVGSLAPLAPIPGPATPPPTPPTSTPATPTSATPAPTPSPTPPKAATPVGSSGTPATGDSGGSGSGGGGDGGGGGQTGPLVNTAAAITIPPHLPLRFEANQGQKNASVQFSSQSNGYNLFLTATEMVVSLPPPATVTPPAGPHHGPPPLTTNPQWVVRMAFVGASASGLLTGVGLTPEVAHYLVGNNPAQWHTNVPVYGEVSYHSVYPGIDLLYYANAQHQLEYDFTVNPGASPGTIKLAFAGAQALYVNSHGDLVAHTPYGDVVEHAPLAYQMVNGVPQGVSCAYVAPDPGHVSFQVGAYNPSLPLVIDPSLVYSTYFGGSGIDQGNAIAVDAQGNAYVAGTTASTDLPGGSGQLFGPTAAYDAFVTKLAPQGQNVVFTDYLGGATGTSADAYGIAVGGAAGNIYLTGMTNSPNTMGAGFPTTPGALQTSLAGSQNAFLTEIKSDGTALIYSTYLGGAGTDTGYGLTLGAGGNVYLNGMTSSTNFPTAHAFQGPAFGANGSNAFVADLILPTAGPGTATLVYSSYLGGSGTDAAYGIAVDPNGNAYVTGSTTSPNFPTHNPYQAAKHGSGSNAFVTEIAPPPTGGGPAAIAYSSYLGGSGGADLGNGIALGGSGNVYLTGATDSSDFPTTAAYQPAYGSQGQGRSNAFVTDVTLPPAQPPGGPTTLVYSTYLGGSGTDGGNGIAVDSAGDAYVVGQTASLDFPVVNPLPGQHFGGQPNVFLTEVAAPPPSGAVGLVYSTYLGGSGTDLGLGVAVDGSGNAYLTGPTTSDNFPTAVVPPATAPIQGELSSSGEDAFVAEVGARASITLQMFNPPPATEGASTGNLELASFTYGKGQPIDYSATVDWGDGLPDTMVTFSSQDAASCCLDVVTSHLYMEDGALSPGMRDPQLANNRFVITVTVQGDAATGSVWGRGYASILVLDAGLSGSGTTLTTQESVALTGPGGAPVVGSLTDQNPGANPGLDFVAVNIDWGDGHASSGSVQAAAGQSTCLSSYPCSVVAGGTANIYAEEGVYTITVLITDNGGSRLTLKSTAIVQKQPLALPPAPYAPVVNAGASGVPFSFNSNCVTTYTDGLFLFNAGLYDPPSDFAININWGDGTQGPGTVVPPCEVGGNRTSGWSNSGGNYQDDFRIAATHAYNYPTTIPSHWPIATITITITDVRDGGSLTETGTAYSFPDSCEPNVLATIATFTNLTEGYAFPPPNAVLATITWPGSGGPSGLFVDWGDDTSPTEYTNQPGGGISLVQGTTDVYDIVPRGNMEHYYEDGTYTIKVLDFASVDSDGCAYASQPVTINEASVTAASLSATGVSLGQDPVQGQVFNFASHPLLTFYDANTSAMASEFAATFSYVAGQPHAASVVSRGQGAFDVDYNGTYTWSSPGDVVVTVTIADNVTLTDTSSPVSATFFGSAQVDPTPITSLTWAAWMQPITQPAPYAVTGEVASFNGQPGSGGQGGSYSATIEWGDGGTPTTGTVVYESGSQYEVLGSYTYARPGDFVPQVLVNATSSDYPVWAQATGPQVTITVAPAGAVTVQGVPITATEGQPLASMTLLANVMDTNQPPTSLVQAAINWGDGTTTVEPNLNGAATYSVVGSHTYYEEGSYLVTITVDDQMGGHPLASGVTTAVVGEAAAQLRPNPLTVARQPPPGGAVYLTNVLLATLSDPSPEPMSTYRAFVDWGDGTSDRSGAAPPFSLNVGIAPGPHNTFYLYGSHTYYTTPPFQLDGQFLVKVVLDEDGLLAAQAVTPVTVVRAGVALLNDPVVGEFYNPNNPPLVNNYVGEPLTGITTNWGDGSPPSTFYALTPHNFANLVTGVQSPHIYFQSGSPPPQVNYIDDPGQSVSGALANWAVAPAPVVITETLPSWYDNAAYPGVNATMNQPLGTLDADGRLTGSVALATFADADPAATPAWFKASISWGDGTTSPGAIAGNAGDTFTVLGFHTYQAFGIMTIGIAVSGGAGPLAVTRTTANVAPDPQVHQRQPGTRLEVGSPASADGGQVTLAPNTGAIQVFQPLDFRLSHDSSLDGFIDLDGNPLQGLVSGDDRPLNAPPGTSPGSRSYGALVYNSDTVSPKPLAEVDAYFPAIWGVPVTLTAELSVNGQDVLTTFTTSGHKPGDTYALAVQTTQVFPTTGVYPWTMHVHATFWRGPAQDEYFTGNALVVNNNTSPFGAGWSLYGVNELVLTPEGALMVYGSGAAPRLFPYNCTATGFVSPPDDFGTLSRISTYTYAYTSKYGVTWTYDASSADLMHHTLGVLTAITDPHNLILTLSYDTSQQLNPKLNWLELPDGAYTTVTSSMGQVILQEPGSRLVTLALDNHMPPQLTAITDVDGTGRAFGYDSNNHHWLTSLVWSPLTITFTYDPNGSGAVTKVDQGQGTTWQLQPSSLVGFGTPNPMGPPTAVNAKDVQATLTNALNNRSSYTLDFRGWVTQLATPDGSNAYWARDPSEQVNVYLDPLQRATVYGYSDGVGDLVQINHPDFGVEQLGYQPMPMTGPALHRRTGYVDPDGNPTSYAFDSYGDLVTTTDALFNQVIQHWNTTLALLTAVTDQRGNPTSYAFYTAATGPSNRLLQTRTDAQPATMTYNYDVNGYANQIQDALGRLTTPTYDKRGRLVQSENALLGYSTLAYNALGEVTTQINADLETTVLGYDPHGWLTRTVEAAGSMPSVQRTTTTAYDAAGNLVTVTRNQNYDSASTTALVTTAYQYDVLNRPTTAIQDAGNLAYASLTAYDPVGNVLSTTDPRGVVTSYGYDPLNRRTVAIADYGPLGTLHYNQTTTTLYDLAGNVLGTIDARGIATGYAYDLLNRQTAVTQAVGVPQQQRSTITTYDPAGNVLAVSTPEASLSPTMQGYDLDALGLPTTALHVTTSYGYDVVNRRTATIENYQTSVPPALERTTQTAYDLVGNVTTVTTEQTYDGAASPVLATMAYGYDKLNRQTAATQAFGTTLQRTTATVYDAIGNVVGSIDARNVLSSYGYDALNRRTVAIADYSTQPGHVNQTVTTLYDAANNVTLTYDPRNTQTATAYDDLNRATAVIQAATTAVASTSTLTYDRDGNLVQTVQPQTYDNQTTAVLLISTYAYDLLNRQTAMTQAVGTTAQRTTTTVYDLDNNVVASVDAANVTTLYGFDALNRRTAVVQAASMTGQQRTTSTAYDAANNVVAVATPQSYDTASSPVRPLTLSSYDPLNRLVSMTEAVGAAAQQRTTTYGYDAASNLTLLSQPQGYDLNLNGTPNPNPVHVLTSYGYDLLNRRTLTVADYGDINQTTSVAYDPNNNVTSSTDPRGTLANTVFDNLNRPVSVTQAANSMPLARTTNTSYDLAGSVLAVTQPQGYDHDPHPVRPVTSYGYDPRGRQTLAISDFGGPNQQTVTTVYDAANNVVATQAPLGRSTAYALDVLNRRTAVTDSGGHTTTTIYTPTDLTLSSIDARNQVTSYGYDALRRQTLQLAGYGQYSGGTITPYSPSVMRPTTTTYDAADNVLTVATPAGTTTNTYDLLNRKTLIDDPRTGLTGQGFDAANNLRLVRDPDGNLTSYQYDLLNRQTVTIDPQNHRTTTLYDQSGNVTSTTDRDNRTRLMAYDVLNRLTTEVWYASGGSTPINTLTYGYDAADNTLTGSSNAGAVAMTFDTLNREKTEQGVFGVTLTSSYNLGDDRTLVQDSLGAQVSSTYNAADLLQARELNVTYTTGPTTVSYDIEATLAYDATDEPTTLAYLRNTGSWQTAAVGQTGWDIFGDLQSFAWNQNSTTGPALVSAAYSFDTSGRMTADQRTQDATPSTHDPGNKQNFSYLLTDTYDADNELTTITTSDNLGSAYGYDANGNRTQQNGGTVSGSYNQVTSDPNWTYGYDWEGNVTSKASRTGGPTWSFGYDDDNHLTSATQTSGSTTEQLVYSYDAFGNLVQRSDTLNSVTTVTRYVMDGDQVWADLNSANQAERWYLDGDQTDQLFARVEGPYTDLATSVDKLHWYVQDHQGSVIDVLTSDASGADEWARYQGFGLVAGDLVGTLAGEDRFGYTGQPVDPSTSLMYDSARWYDPASGRFQSQDPLGLEPDTNPYRYAGNGPTDGTDPSGLMDPKAKPYAAYLQKVAPWFVALDTEQNGAVGLYQWKDAGYDIELFVKYNRSDTGFLTYKEMASALAAGAFPTPPVSRAQAQRQAKLDEGFVELKSADELGGRLDQLYSRLNGIRKNLTSGPESEHLRFTLNGIGDYLDKLLYLEVGQFYNPEFFADVSSQLDRLAIQNAANRDEARRRFLASRPKPPPIVPPAPKLDFGTEATRAFWETLIDTWAHPWQVVTGPVQFAGSLLTDPVGTVEGVAESIKDNPGRFAGQTAFNVLLGKALGELGGALSEESSWAAPRIHQCFPAGTLVATSSGLKPIETVQPGALVWSYEFRSGQWVLGRVEIGHSAEYDGQFLTLLFEDGAMLEVTADHPFWVVEGVGLSERPQLHFRDAYEDSGLALPGRWVHSQALQVGDRLYGRLGKSVPIQAILCRDDRRRVYNLAVLGRPYYAVGPLGVLVHNTETEGSGLKFPTTPSAKITRWIQGQGGYLDPATNKWIVEPSIPGIQAAHIFPSSRIKQLPGFDKLTKAQQDFLLNHPDNFIPLTQQWNASMGNRLADEWVKTPRGRRASKEFVDQLRKGQEAFERMATEQIAIWLDE